ncbi:NAD(P)-dependent glycerol-3-phosphate dehydrogenase [Marinihelvus fidelis]|uniref:Glycerol-3-phosphate dehydrogenase [NAD(P)+] n=1 Tax=Marinihelvus fidelis TaxID=2613842 RepID=A0A5N0TA13_9GAMM|nr:NAD(P)H-dependent glycerol-3-phosphate dehydrogenase [Marinihelvus fidelis]KAA9131855.1 NAD(P)-dependent glycerol-3-phosphate dehydrogenase [Marinihelvus fidelis]
MSRAATAIGVLGAGSWGTALAIQLARNGQAVSLWARDPEHVAAMAADRRNARYLPDNAFPDGLQPTADFDAAVAAGDVVLVAAPSHAFADTITRLQPLLQPGQGIVWACKGFEPGTGRLLHEVAQKQLGDDVPLGAITGPSFAREVAMGLPTAVTVAAFDEDFSREVAQRLHGEAFRAYTSTDMVGAELGGAVKNVLAVATGIADGMGLGDNARAALVTRGLAEMMRLGEAMGARPETLTGLAGMGDLVLTCTGDLSRNRRLGLALGRGDDIETAVRDIGQVVEGIGTSTEVRRLSKAHDVSMPISREVFGIIHQGQDPKACVRRLLARDQKPEHAS